MEENQSRQDCITQNAVDIQYNAVPNDLTSINQSDQQPKDINSNLNIGHSIQTSEVITNNELCSSTNLITNESLANDIQSNSPVHLPPPSPNEPDDKEAIESIEDIEKDNVNNKNENSSFHQEIASNNFQKSDNYNSISQEISISNSENVINENSNIIDIPNSSEDHSVYDNIDHYSSIGQIEKLENENQNDLYEVNGYSQRDNNIQEEVNTPDENPSINFSPIKSITPPNNNTKRNQFLDLDIPKPVFSSDEENDHEDIHLPPEPNNSTKCLSPVDLDVAVKAATLDEFQNESFQIPISNQSTQRIEAPQAFIPSSQLVMTKKALEEGNLFLKRILDRLKNINQNLLEKTSKAFQ